MPPFQHLARNLQGWTQCQFANVDEKRPLVTPNWRAQKKHQITFSLLRPLDCSKIYIIFLENLTTTQNFQYIFKLHENFRISIDSFLQQNTIKRTPKRRTCYSSQCYPFTIQFNSQEILSQLLLCFVYRQLKTEICASL